MEYFIKAPFYGGFGGVFSRQTLKTIEAIPDKTIQFVKAIKPIIDLILLLNFIVFATLSTNIVLVFLVDTSLSFLTKTSHYLQKNMNDINNLGLYRSHIKHFDKTINTPNKY